MQVSLSDMCCVGDHTLERTSVFVNPVRITSVSLPSPTLESCTYRHSGDFRFCVKIEYTFCHSFLGRSVSSSATSIEVIRFGEFEANLRSRELRRSGSKVRLPDQSFAVLAMLLDHPGELVAREDVRNTLWPVDTFVDFDHGLNNAVNRLRDAFGVSAELGASLAWPAFWDAGLAAMATSYA